MNESSDRLKHLPVLTFQITCFFGQMLKSPRKGAGTQGTSNPDAHITRDTPSLSTATVPDLRTEHRQPGHHHIQDVLLRYSYWWHFVVYANSSSEEHGSVGVAE